MYMMYLGMLHDATYDAWKINMYMMNKYIRQDIIHMMNDEWCIYYIKTMK